MPLITLPNIINFVGKLHVHSKMNLPALLFLLLSVQICYSLLGFKGELYFRKRLNAFLRNFGDNAREADEEFDYGNGPKGPVNWPKLYPECGGNRQSPINITLSSLRTKLFGKLQWSPSYWQVPDNIGIINNGHTVEVRPSLRNAPSIKGGPLKSTYKLEQIHFHWGTVNSRGSEHTQDGRRFPMEIHAVHLKENLTMEEATKIPDGIAVVGYFVEIVRRNNSAINWIQESFDFIRRNPGVEGTVSHKFPMNRLAKDFYKGYVTYNGSLTTPPCSESVVWIIAPFTVGITNEQLGVFRSLYSTTSSLRDNFRPVQPLNGRPVYFALVKPLPVNSVPMDITNELLEVFQIDLLHGQFIASLEIISENIGKT